MFQRRLYRVLSLMLFVFLIARQGYPTMLVMQKDISVSRALNGRVLVPRSEEPVGEATIELCSSDWKTVIASTKTDVTGRFTFEQRTRSKLYYIRVSAPGMDIYQLRVHIDKHAKPSVPR